MRVWRWFVRLLSRATLLIGSIFSLLVLLIPPLVFAVWGFFALWNRTDYYLSQAAPIVAAEASRLLERPVQIGSLSPGLTVEALYKMIQHPQDFGSLAVVASNIYIRNRPDEENLAGGPLLASASRLTAFVSLPALLAGDFQAAVKRLIVESPEVVIVRDPKGKINLENFAPQKGPTEPAQPPFRTVVEVTNGKARFRDYQARFAAVSLPAENNLLISQGVVDLTGARQIAFSATGRALPGSPSVAHIGGPLIASGVVRREEGLREEMPSVGAPQLLMALQLTDADISYWVSYLLPPQQDFRVETGRADGTVSVTMPYTAVKPEIAPEIAVDGRLRNGKIVAKALPVAAENLSGTLSFRQKTLRFDVKATVADAPLAASGAVWNLTDQPYRTRPQLSVSVDAPRLPVARLLTLLPKGQKLPPGVSVGGVAAVKATVEGALTGKLQDIAAVGSVAGLDAAYTGYPALRNLQADIAVAGGLLRIARARASLGRSGTVFGAGAARLDAKPIESGDAVFSVKASNVNLDELTALKDLSRHPDEKLRLRGMGSVEAAGQRIGGRLTAAANVTSRDLQVGNLPFPVAQARILVQDNQILVPTARIESPAGIARIEGNVGDKGQVSLRFALGALDLKRLSLAFGINGVEGIVSTNGTITGTVRDPKAQIARFEALNLHYTAPMTGGKATRPILIDVVSAANLSVTRQTLTIPAKTPLTLRRFPAAATIEGKVSALTPQGKAQWNPRLALNGSLENLDYAEVERQLGMSIAASAPRSVVVDRRTGLSVPEEIGFAPWNERQLIVRPGDSVQQPLSRELPPISGSVTRAAFKATGTVNDPTVTGTVALGSLQVASYPLQSGSFAFSFTKAATVLSDISVKATVGTLTGSATIRGNGTITGALNAPALDLTRLVYLTNDEVNLEGALAVSATFQGTLDRPVVRAQISAPTVSVAGTTYTDLLVDQIQFVGNRTANHYVLQIPSASLAREDTRIEVTKIYADFTSGDVQARLNVVNGDVATLLDTLRRSGISQSEAGARLLRTIGQLPYPISARFDIADLTFRGKQTKGTLSDVQAKGTLTARNLQLGQFTADTLNAEAAVEGKKIIVSSLDIVRPGSTIRGQGSYEPGGMVNASIDSNDFSLDIVRSIPGLESFPVRGSLESFTVTANGPADSPRLDLSLQGRNLELVTQKAAENAGQSKTQERSLVIPLLRLSAFVEQDENKRYRIVVPEDGFTLQRGKLQIQAQAELPFSYENDPTLADRPVSVKLRIPNLNLNELEAILAPVAVVPQNPETLSAPDRFAAQRARNDEAAREKAKTQIAGIFAANVSLGGTLRQPQLDGLVTLEKGHFRLGREPGSDRDKINPIKQFDARLVLDGNQIRFDAFKLTLDGLNGQKGDFGDLQLSGAVTVNTLQNLQRLLNRQAQQTDIPPLDGLWNLTAKLRNFRPSGDDLFRLREQFRLRADGTLNITGKLTEPLIATPAGQPLQLADSEARLPLDTPTTGGGAVQRPINPTLNIQLIAPKKASIIGQSSLLPFRFDVRGAVSLTGPLFFKSGTNVGQLALNATSELTTTGGFVQFPTALFKVDKNGVINVRFNGINPGITASNVTATSRILTRGSTTVSGGLSGTDALFGAGTTSYKVTLTLNGPLDLLTEEKQGNGNTVAKSGGSYTLVSDPALPESQIIGLIVGSSLISSVQQGRTEDALRTFAAQAFTSSYLPRYLAPITDSLASSLGLDEIRLDYSPTAPRVSFLKQLSKPFDRVYIEASRLLRVQAGQQQTFPFRLSTNYEIFQFRATDKVQPRIRIGVDYDEQGTITYFTRGTISY